MMELELIDGDYTLCGGGGYTRLYGYSALLSRVLFRLSAKRGGFPLMPEMGSELWLLPSKPRSGWEREAYRAVCRALADEPVQVASVSVCEQSGRLKVAAELEYNGETIIAEVTAA